MAWLLLIVLMSVLAGCGGSAPAGPTASAPSTLPAPASAPASAPALASPRHDLSGLGNFAQVSLALYRGEKPTAEGFRRLKAMGVKTVVNLESFHSDRAAMAGTGMRYVHLHCKAWNPEEADVVAFLKVVQDPASQPVFVHCAQGADRTGTMVAVYRVVEEGWPMERAVEEMQRFGFHPIWTKISAYLREFDGTGIRAKVAATTMPRIDVVE